MEIPAASNPYWDAQRFVIGRVGKASLEAIQDKPAESKDPYSELGLNYADTFQDIDHDRVHGLLDRSSKPVSPEEVEYRKSVWRYLRSSGGVRHGFEVMGKLLGYAPETYVAYTASAGKTATLEELEGIVRHTLSFERTAFFLAEMPQTPTNKAWERAANLTADAYARWSGQTPLEVIEDQSGTYFDFSIATRIGAINNMADIRPAIGEPATCPAAGVFLPKLWQHMVTTCLNRPDLFTADLTTHSDIPASR